VKVLAASAGDYHSAALGYDGEIWTCGFSVHGQLALGSLRQTTNFTKVSDLIGKKFVGIAAGGFHTLALEEGGKVWAAGFNGMGTLGLGDRVERDVFVETIGLSGKRITAIAAGSDHSVALTSEGEVFVSGWNFAGQVGLGEKRLFDAIDEYESAVFSE
jgi:alpha-tubulin suppressor-like RCC1 family protein